MRCCTTAWELTSIKQYSQPSATISANKDCKVTASGVVCVASDSRRCTI